MNKYEKVKKTKRKTKRTFSIYWNERELEVLARLRKMGLVPSRSNLINNLLEEGAKKTLELNELMDLFLEKTKDFNENPERFKAGRPGEFITTTVSLSIDLLNSLKDLEDDKRILSISEYVRHHLENFLHDFLKKNKDRLQ